MAITLTGSTYAGYFSDVTLASAVLGARTIENGYVTVHSQVDDAYTVVFADTSVDIKDANGEFAGSTNAELTEIKFNLGKYMINAEIDYKALDNFWLASQQPRGAAGDYVPPADLESALNAHYAAKAALMVGASIWSGSAIAINQFGTSQGIAQSGSNQVDGLIKKMLADSAVVDIAVGGTYKQTITAATDANPAVVTVGDVSDYAIGDIVTFEGLAGGTWATKDGLSFSITAIDSVAKTLTLDLDASGLGTWTGGTLTCINKNNVIPALEECYRNMSDSIRLAPDTKFYMNSRVVAAYKLKQAEAAYAPNVYSTDYTLSFLGYEIAEAPEMRHNCVVVAKVSSLHFATPLLSDLNQVLIVDQSTTSASRTIRYRLDFAFDCNISGGRDITLLS